jgi:hypothetical protein
MEANISEAGKQFEALQKSVSGLNNLRSQMEQAQKLHTNLVKEFLEAVERAEPSQWDFKIVEKNKIVSEGPLNKQTLEIFTAILSGAAIAGVGDPVCIEHAGCAVVGQHGTNCIYLCKTVRLP